MNIVVSSPGSPGTSFTDNVKDQIVTIYDVLESNDDFGNAGELRKYLEDKYGFKQAYSRNILAFLQNCGLVRYQDLNPFENKRFFTNIGKTYVDVLKCLKTVRKENSSEDIQYITEKLKSIEEIIYFQSLVLMMKDKNCNYAQDFFDVLRFIDKYGSIDSTEYLLIQYERENGSEDFIANMSEKVQQYRNGQISIEIKTKTKNDEQGAAKSVNSFPYVSGNFTKAGILNKDESGRFLFNRDRHSEIEVAIKEVGAIWQNSVQ